MREAKTSQISLALPPVKKDNPTWENDNWARSVHLCNVSKQTIPLKYFWWLWTAHICYVMYRMRRVIDYLKGNFPAVLSHPLEGSPWKDRARTPWGEHPWIKAQCEWINKDRKWNSTQSPTLDELEIWHCGSYCSHLPDSRNSKATYPSPRRRRHIFVLTVPPCQVFTLRQ